MDIEKEYGNPVKEFDKKFGKYEFIFRFLCFLAFMNLFTLLILKFVIYVNDGIFNIISNISSLAILIGIGITAIIRKIQERKFDRKWNKNFEEIHGRLLNEMKELLEKKMKKNEH